MSLSVLAASTAVAGNPPANRGSASHALPAATMSEAIRGSDFFGAEGGGETKYEVSHVVGKGSYGLVWCELQRPSCARAMSGSSITATTYQFGIMIARTRCDALVQIDEESGRFTVAKVLRPRV